MNDLVSRERVLESLDPDRIFPEYIVQTIAARIKELPSAGPGRKKRGEKSTPESPSPNSLTVLEI